MKDTCSTFCLLQEMLLIVSLVTIYCDSWPLQESILWFQGSQAYTLLLTYFVKLSDDVPDVGVHPDREEEETAELTQQ